MEVNTYDIVYATTLSSEEGYTLPENAPTTYTYDEKTTLVNPTMEGYTFKGWYLENGKKVTYLAAKTYTDDIVLYAKWTEK